MQEIENQENNNYNCLLWIKKHMLPNKRKDREIQTLFNLKLEKKRKLTLISQ